LSGDEPVKRRDPSASVMERLVEQLRQFGVRSVVLAITAVGILAGLLSASDISEPLWLYVGMTALAFVLVLVSFMLGAPRYRLWLFSLVYRRPVARDPQNRPFHGNIHGSSADAPVLQIAIGRHVDQVYESGFRALLDVRDPIAVIASSPRDVASRSELPSGMFSRGGSRTECTVDPAAFGVPIRRYTFGRHLTEGNQDIDHMLAVKDLMYLPHLAGAFRVSGARGNATAEPFVWPEHCVDIPLLADRDPIIIGGGDSNFWHAALFEAVFRRFATPPSTVPLALDLRYMSGQISFYGSRTINVHLAGRDRIPGLEGARHFELDERRFPTCAMILACENPFAGALKQSRPCIFIAGTRSLGTSGAVLALAAMLERMRSDERINYFSFVQTADPDVKARVSAILCRTVVVEHAAEHGPAPLRRRRRVPIPTDKADPSYRSSYVPTAVEYLDNTRERPEWRLLVSLERDERADQSWLPTADREPLPA
jgi:hypothetical protein